MNPKDAESIQAFATETAAALLRIGEAHNKLHDRVEALEKTLSSQPSPSEADRLRARIAELEGIAERFAQVYESSDFDRPALSRYDALAVEARSILNKK